MEKLECEISKVYMDMLVLFGCVLLFILLNLLVLKKYIRL